MSRIEPSEVVRRLAASKAARDRTTRDAGARLPWTERFTAKGRRRRIHLRAR